MKLTLSLPSQKIRCAGPQSGIGALEFLIALPLLLMLGLGAWQWAIVLQARQLLEHAAVEAAREGALGHANEQSIDRGLARGMLAFWGDRPIGDAETKRAYAHARLSEARQANWIEWRQLSPTRESFGDWAESAIDAGGRTLPGVSEIPIDNLDARIRSMRPASGVDRWFGIEPIGRSSGQTLRDASVLRIELQVALPLRVPLAGRFIAAASGWPQSCVPPCLLAQAQAGASGDVSRILIRVHGEARMQTPPRLSARTPARTDRLDGTGKTIPHPEVSALPGSVQSTDPVESVPTNRREPSVPEPNPAPSIATASSPESTPVAQEIWAPGACGMQPG